MSPLFLLSLLVVLLVFVCPHLSSADYTTSKIVSTAYGFEVNATLSASGPYGKDVKNLWASIWYETPERVRVRIRDADSSRWEIPADFLHIESRVPPRTAPTNPLYVVTVSSTHFGFQVARRPADGGEVLFDTTNFPLTFEDQFLQISSTLPSKANLYGLGERIVPYRLPFNDYSIWNEDRGNPQVQNLYGHHPIYHRIENSGRAHAVVLWNSNMMDVNFTDGKITYTTIGGILDFYFLLGPTPLSLTTQYTEMVGRPFMPPRFSIGWHQCKWGYSSANYTREVAYNYTINQIPLDVIWNDIDYMTDYFPWTYNGEYGSKGFMPQDVAALNAWLASMHMHHIFIVDPNIPAVLVDKDKQPYLPYTTGKATGVFVRHPADDTFLWGKQWPPVTVAWPDWTNPAALQWQTDNIRRFGAIAGLPSGIWLDMNEPSNFCDGQITDGCQGSKDSSRVLDPDAVPHPPHSSPTDIPMPKYWPGMSFQSIEGKGFNMSSHLYLGQHYNVKEFWGMSEQRVTAMALMNLTNKRAFTLSRSTFMGSGQYGAHWLGDNNSGWDHLQWSISEVLTFGLFGVTMVGADVCGFGGDTTPELCARWIQVGALYPFARDHSSIGSRDQEAYRFGEPYVTINRRSISLRYMLLPYLYTLYVESHLYGYPIWRGVVQEWPQDPNTYALDRQFMLGPGLMGIPILTQGATSVTGYLPNADWFTPNNFSRIQSYDPNSQSGQYHTWYDTLNSNSAIPLALRGGYVGPTQEPALTTYDTAMRPFRLYVSLNSTGLARGHLVLDDGETIGNINAGDYTELEYFAVLKQNNNVITGTFTQTIVRTGSYDISMLILGGVAILGLDLTSSQGQTPTLQVNGQPVSLDGATISVMAGAWVLDLSTAATTVPMDAQWTFTFSSNQQHELQTSRQSAAE